MTVRAWGTLALVAVSLRLLPPGWSDKAHVFDSSKVKLPAALAHGPRAGMNEPPMKLHAEVSPAPARLGQQLVYRAHTHPGYGDVVDFAPPEPGGDFTWGTPRTGHKGAPGWATEDSVWMEVPLQVFRTGIVSIPGPLVRVRQPGRESRPLLTRLPTVHLFVMPTVTSADTAATLRPPHGPLGAPWYERVPWRIVFAALAGLLAAIALVRFLVRLRGRPVPAPAAATPARPVIDPATEALRALAELRAQSLPEGGRFGEHALALTRILRRYLERSMGTPRPGDTSTELMERVRASRLDREDVQRLEGLLGTWDRVKFARAPFDLDEALRCEGAVELLVRRQASPREVA